MSGTQHSNAVYLPGADKSSNEEWVEALADSFSSLFVHSHIHRYSNWSDGGDVDISLELDTLSETLNDMDSYGLIAKSAGGLIALRGMYEGKLQPDYLVCLGFPLPAAQHESLPADRWLKHTDVPIVIMQNIDDPVGSYDDVSTWVNKQNKRVVFVPLPGETHDYQDFHAIREIVQRVSAQLLY